MTAGCALVSGSESTPTLAGTAVRRALEQAGLSQAAGVVLFLSTDFARQPQLAILAAARESGCLQVFGMVANGLFTDSGWSLDQPAAAALVVGNGISLKSPDPDDSLRIALAGTPALPNRWESGPVRQGLINGALPVWQQARVAEPATVEAQFTGGKWTVALSTGLHRLGEPMPVTAVRAYDVDRIGDQSAQESLLRAMPSTLRGRKPLPIHLLCAVTADGQPIPLLAANADGSLTFAAPLTVGETIRWAIRQPLTAEVDMRDSLAEAASLCRKPSFGLMFSCIGRGPLFYGSEDLDLLAFRQRFPGVPLLGAYGSGQIVHSGGRNRQFQNSALTLLFETSHV